MLILSLVSVKTKWVPMGATDKCGKSETIDRWIYTYRVTPHASFFKSDAWKRSWLQTAPNQNLMFFHIFPCLSPTVYIHLWLPYYVLCNKAVLAACNIPTLQCCEPADLERLRTYRMSKFTPHDYGQSLYSCSNSGQAVTSPSRSEHADYVWHNMWLQCHV